MKKGSRKKFFSSSSFFQRLSIGSILFTDQMYQHIKHKCAILGALVKLLRHLPDVKKQTKAEGECSRVVLDGIVPSHHWYLQFLSSAPFYTYLLSLQLSIRYTQDRFLQLSVEQRRKKWRKRKVKIRSTLPRISC